MEQNEIRTASQSLEQGRMGILLANTTPARRFKYRPYFIYDKRCGGISSQVLREGFQEDNQYNEALKTNRETMRELVSSKYWRTSS